MGGKILITEEEYQQICELVDDMSFFNFKKLLEGNYSIPNNYMKVGKFTKDEIIQILFYKNYLIKKVYSQDSLPNMFSFICGTDKYFAAYSRENKRVLVSWFTDESDCNSTTYSADGFINNLNTGTFEIIEE